jgi:2'-5' RNA ligase
MRYKSQIKMKRIFIAVKIDPGETLLNVISSFKTGLKDEQIKWTESENFHITLAFLGDTEDAKVKAIYNMLRPTCEGFGEFEIMIKGAGVFKNFRWIISEWEKGRSEPHASCLTPHAIYILK